MTMQSDYKSITGVRGHITRGIKFLTEALDSDAGIPYLESQNTALEKRWAKYETQWDQFVELYGEEESQDERDQKHVELSTKYHSVQLRLSLYIKQNVTTAPNPGPPPTRHPFKVVLPEIKLKDFTGDTLDWTRFWNQFSSSVHSRTDIDDVTKYLFLTQCVKGNAQKVLARFRGEASDYGDAIKALTDMYGDKDKIRRTLIRSLINLNKPKYVASEIFHFKVDVETFLMQLDHDPEIDVAANEMLLRELLVMKLPKEVEDYLFNNYKTRYFSVNQIKEGLQLLLNSMEAEIKTSSQKSLHNNVKQQSQSQASSSSSSSDSTKPVGSYTTFSNFGCIFCKGDHKPYECSNYATYQTRKERLKALKRCIRCTKSHQTSECNKVIEKCRRCQKGKHHLFLCASSTNTSNFQGSSSSPSPGNSLGTSKFANNNSGINNSSNVSKSDPVSTNQVTSVVNSRISTFNYGVALATAMVTIQSDNGQSVKARCFFDNGSQRSFILKDLANQLDLKPVANVDMTLKGFFNTSDDTEFQLVKPIISLGSRKRRVVLAVVDEMPSQITTPGLGETIRNLRSQGYQLADNDISSDVVDNIQLLIGSDCFGRFISGLTNIDDVDLFESPGGYLVYGVMPLVNEDHINCQSTLVARVTAQTVDFSPSVTEPRTVNSCVINETIPVHKLWDLDVVGINPLQESPNDLRSLFQYENSVKHCDGRYWVELPFKYDHPFLPTNYSLALAQMHNQIRKFQHQSELLKCYDDIFHEQERLGFIEEVINPVVSPNTHYLPHHAVKKETSSTPIRIVYNCSAKMNKTSASLNNCLLTGPSLTEKLFDSLIKFRANEYACVADIEKAFLQVGLQEHHRDFTRFLWVEDPFDEYSKVKTFRFKSVLFGATCSPFLLQMTLQHHFQLSQSPYADVLSSSFYVDNLQLSIDNEQELVKIYDAANSELYEAGMNLRQWNTNSVALKEHIVESLSELVEFPPVNKVLGLNWEISTDSIFLNHCQFEPLQSVTKRQLLSLISTCFDPLGMCTPILIKGKRLIQLAWKEQVGWDVRLPPSFLESWNTLAQEIVELPLFKFPRCICQLSKSYILHLFVDASTAAYGAVCYLSDGEKSHFVASKARVAPLKTRTLPQLELTALQLGTQFACCIRKICSQFSIVDIIIWSDSEVALQWLKNGNSKITYVQNRVANIREIGSSFKYFYVPTKENPADLITRGISLDQFRKSNFWIEGPSWLPNDRQWPEQKFEIVICEIVTEIMPEVPLPEALFDYSKYSSLRRLLLVTRFVYNFLKILMPNIVLTDPLIYWIRYVQQTHYPRVCAFLSNDLSSLDSEKVQFISDLGLYYDESDGLVHSRGRLHHSDLDQSSKFPILIPTKSHLAYLLIVYAHEKCLHGGVKDTLSYVRRHYWMPKSIQSIKKIIKSCVICKRVEGRRFGYPGPPPLPAERVQFSRPFEHVGIDYSGPIIITKTEDGKPHKYYIVLFTCTASRLVHLELASDMSAVTFINLFRRFCAMYSHPVSVISDNGTYFIASAKFFEKLLCHNDVQRYMENNRIKWRFIAPRAPWQGGFYERLIGITKSCMRKVLFKKRVNRDELETVLKEIQCRINNRPLTYIDGNEPLEALAPIHLWCGRIIDPIPSIVLYDRQDPEYLDHSDLNLRYSQVSSILKKFESVWKKEYLTALREKHYGGRQACQDKPPKIGEVVIVERSGPQQEWPLGRIVKLYHDSENVIRVVDVLCDGAITKRTLDKLVPIEIQHPCIDSTSVQGEESQTISDETEQQHGNSGIELRPSRHAAQRAARLRQVLIDNNQL